MKGAEAPADSLEPSPEIVRILEEYMAEVENGRQPNIEEIVSRYPNLADLGEHLRDCLTSLEFLHPTDPRQSLELQADSVADLPLPDPRLGQLGDFGLIREIGRGGMGIVYEAVQISLHRRVALKVLPFAAALDGKQLQRFKNEALAAAGLHHPHIVPIHAVGSERGVHYYAMQLIEGKSLADAIIELRGQKDIENEKPKIQDRESKTENRGSGVGISAGTVEYHANGNETPRVDRPAADHPSSPVAARSLLDPPSSLFKSRSPFFRRVAQLGIEAADALGHAHRLGIIHRDVKPANFMLDEEGKLWVTDFGLALVQHNMDLTATGDMLGTLRYMSPEQASSKRGLIDQRTDIYSLGATLYELLTLQPAFPEKDRNELLAKIATQEPRMPRRLNAAIPKDLETIVLKSMAKNPQERYLTAEDLAEDLKRFMDDRPIRATRPSLLEQTIKWCRRHKALVAGAGLITIAASLLAAIISFEHAQRKEDAYQAKVQHEIVLKEKQQRLLATLDLAHQAMYELSMKPALERLQKNRDPQTRLQDQESLRKVLEYCRQFAEMNRTVPEARFLAAQANRQVGEVYEVLGQPDRSQESYEKCIADLEAIIADNPGELEPVYRQQLALCRHHLGSLFWSNGKTDLAEQTLQKELQELGQLVADYPENLNFRYDLANGRINQSLFFQMRGNYQKAEDVLLENQPVLEKLAADCQSLPYVQKSLADSFRNLAAIYLETDHPDKSEKAFVQALEVLERLTTAYPHNDTFQEHLAIVLQNLGFLHRESGRLEESERTYQRAIALCESLTADSPLVPDYSFQLATQRHQLALTFYKMRRFQESEKLYRQSQENLERLTKDYTGKPTYQKELACCSNNFGLLLETMHRPSEAEDAYARASNVYESLATNFPSALDYQNDLGGSRYNQARLLAKRHETENACQLLQQAIDHELIAVLNNTRNPQYLSSLWAQYLLLLELEVEKGKPEQVRLVLQQAQEKCKDLPPVLNNFAWLMVIQPKPPFGDAKQGLEFAKLAVAKAPENGELWNTLGVAHYRTGNWLEAVNALNQSRALRKGGDSYDFFFLAMAHWQSGDKEQARDWYKKATAALPKNKNPELARVHEEAKKLVEASPTPGSKPAANSK
jgi:serine/threonine protein kinase/Flp pilus assembly protein TadD